MSLVSNVAAPNAVTSSALPIGSSTRQTHCLTPVSSTHFRACFENGRKGDYRNFYEKYKITRAQSFYYNAIEPSYLDLEAPELAQYSFVPPQCHAPTYAHYRPFAIEGGDCDRSLASGVQGK